MVLLINFDIHFDRNNYYGHRSCWPIVNQRDN